MNTIVINIIIVVPQVADSNSMNRVYCLMKC